MTGQIWLRPERQIFQRVAEVVGDAEVQAPVNLGVADFNKDSVFAFFQPDGQYVAVRCGGTFDVFGKELLAVEPKGSSIVSSEA